MNKTLTSEEYWENHKGTIGNFEVSPVHTNALSWLNNISIGNKALDIGCGNGELLCLLQKKGVEIYGLDYSPNSITLAQKMTKETNNINVGMASELPYPDNYFNFIFSLGTLGYLSEKDLEKASKEIFRVLKPQGQVIVRTATKNNKIGTFLLKLKHKGYKTDTNFYSLYIYKKTFKKIGFTILKIKKSIDKDGGNNLNKIIMSALKPFLASTWIILQK